MDRFAFFDATFKGEEGSRGKKNQRYLVTILQQDGAATAAADCWLRRRKWSDLLDVSNRRYIKAHLLRLHHLLSRRDYALGALNHGSLVYLHCQLNHLLSCRIGGWSSRKIGTFSGT